MRQDRESSTIMRYYYDRKTKTEAPELLIFNLMRYYYDHVSMNYDQVEWNVQDSIPDLKIVRKGNNCERDARKVGYDLICIKSLTALNTTGRVASPCKSCLDELCVIER